MDDLLKNPIALWIILFFACLFGAPIVLGALGAPIWLVKASGPVLAVLLVIFGIAIAVSKVRDTDSNVRHNPYEHDKISDPPRKRRGASW